MAPSFIKTHKFSGLSQPARHVPHAIFEVSDHSNFKKVGGAYPTWLDWFWLILLKLKWFTQFFYMEFFGHPIKY